MTLLEKQRGDAEALAVLDQGLVDFEVFRKPSAANGNVFFTMKRTGGKGPASA
jgi:hypothetical protein